MTDKSKNSSAESMIRPATSGTKGAGPTSIDTGFPPQSGYRIPPKGGYTAKQEEAIKEIDRLITILMADGD